MMALSVLLCTIYLLIQTAHSACGTWTVNGQTLDLSCLQSLDIDAVDGEDPPHDYIWSLCSNGVTKNGCGSDAVMVAQTSRTDANACYVLGRWDQSITPTYTEVEGGTWTFRYDNGADDCGNPARTWAPTFVCSPGTIAEYEKVSEIPGSCYYELTVKTQYACTGQSYACPDSDSGNGLSGGWIFIIILFGGIFLYCVVGYIVMGTVVNKEGGLKDFGNNIPQKNFWFMCPSLVMAGCCFSKDFIQGLFNKGGSEYEEPIAAETGDE